MARRDLLAIDDCTACKSRTSVEQRQSLGCGYEPRNDRVHLTVWQPPDGGASQRGYHGPELKHCAGYTCNLPEVIETAVTRSHWKVGALVPACGGERPQEDLMHALLILEGAFNEVEGWLMTPAKDGGGGS